MTAQQSRPNFSDALGSLMERVRILEAVWPGGGIQFGGANPVYGEENTGEWLQATTTGVGPSGYGIYFDSTTEDTALIAAGIDLTATVEDVTILSEEGNVVIDAEDQVLIATDGDASNVVIGSNLPGFNFVKIVGSDRDVVVGAELEFNGLPTSAPAGSNCVWNDSGTLRIT